MVAGVATDELEFQLLNIWLFWRGHGDVGTETHHILHTIKTGSDWPVSAVKLVDDLAGESPASANYPVGTVVISGDGAGDQAVGSPEVNVLVGRV